VQQYVAEAEERARLQGELLDERGAKEHALFLQVAAEQRAAVLQARGTHSSSVTTHMSSRDSVYSSPAQDRSVRNYIAKSGNVYNARCAHSMRGPQAEVERLSGTLESLDECVSRTEGALALEQALHAASDLQKGDVLGRMESLAAQARFAFIPVL
jgi:hypothetical protein